MNDVRSQEGGISGQGKVVKPKDQEKPEEGPASKVVPEDQAAAQGSPSGEPTLSNAQRPEFDPNTVIDARENQEKEGGVSRSKSTGVTGLSDSKNASMRVNEDYMADKYELTGFTVMYKVPDTTDDMQSQEVRVYFDKLEQAQNTIKDNKYFHKDPGADTVVEMEITRGAPTISVNEAMKAEYIDGKWRHI